jgi:hypothetical protein
VEFDWTRILKGQDAAPEPRPPVQHERRARPRLREIPARATPPQPPSPPLPAVVLVPDAPVDRPIFTEVSEAPLLGVPEPAAVDEGESPAAISPASARLGSEGLSRLRARHAEVLARITEKITNPVQSEQLKASAERLNPDTWVTDAEVVAGLEAYETVFDSLRSVVGRRRKRRRRRAAGPDQPQTAATRGDDGTPEADDEENAEPDDTSGGQ